MEDCRFYSSEEAFAFEDVWRTPSLVENLNVNQCLGFGFSPNYLEEISSIEDNGFSIDDQVFQSGKFSTLLDANVPNSRSGSTEEECGYALLNNSCDPRADENVVDKQVREIPVAETVENGSNWNGHCSKTKERSSEILNLAIKRRKVQHDDVGGENSHAKKRDHNAKERLRRMKIHSSYVTLGSLLPVSKISKKRWTAPIIIDKVLDYIPVLESEIEQLTHKKLSMVSALDESKQLILVAKQKRDQAKASNDLTVSVNQVRRGEMILQICRKRDDEDIHGFSKLLQEIEEESIHVISASSLRVCDERECFNIHIQMDDISSFVNGCDSIKEQFISWLT